MRVSGCGAGMTVAMLALAASCGARTTLGVPPPAPRQPELALGALQSCLLGADDAVRCWGSSSAQGDHENLNIEICDPPSPFVLPADNNARHITLSRQFCDGSMCVVTAGGSVRCWSTSQPSKEWVTHVGPSVDVRTGELFGCALGVDGAVRCFGVLPFADGTAAAPNAVPGLSNVVAIAVANNTIGQGHACAIDATGAAFCWGSNLEGQLGDGTPPETSPGSGIPVRVQTPVAFEAITASGLHTCAVDVAGDAWCWGAAGIGDGTAVSRGAPTRVVDLPRKVTAIAAGAPHTCALLEDASVWCWGSNDKGQLGDGTFTAALAPVRVAGLGDTIAIGLGAEHTCAIERDGSVWCWGSNSTCNWPQCTDGIETGQLGVWGIAKSAVPVRVSL